MNTLPVPNLYEALAHHRITVQVIEHGDSWRVSVHCPYWVNKTVVTTWSYSKEFSHHEILAMSRTQQWLQDISGLRLTLKWELQ